MHAIGRLKTGGRQKGTPNRRTWLLVERLEAANLDPIEELKAILHDPMTSPDTRARICCELLKYLYPQRKPIDEFDYQNLIKASEAEAIPPPSAAERALAQELLQALVSRSTAGGETDGPPEGGDGLGMREGGV